MDDGKAVPTVHSVAIITNNRGCESNFEFISRIERYFRANGWSIIEDFGKADKVVVCGCGFHNVMYEKFERTITSLKKMGFPMEDVILMGCLPKTHEGQLRGSFKGKILGFGGKESLDDIISATVPFSKVSGGNILDAHQRYTYMKGRENLFYIKISEGCLCECTFCAIKTAHGYIKSVPKEAIGRQFKKAVDSGHRSIFFIGQDTFAYGVDGGDNIVGLVDYLLGMEPDVTMFFGGLNSRWVEKYPDDILRMCDRGVVSTLHIVIQHVNKRILAAMGRPFDFEKVYETVRRIKTGHPGIVISTDIIVGFPGETEEEFQELLDFFKKDRYFDRVEHAAYGDIAGTESFKLGGKVDAKEKAFRWGRLRKVLGNRSPYNNPEVNNFNWMLNRDYTFCSGTFTDV